MIITVTDVNEGPVISQDGTVVVEEPDIPNDLNNDGMIDKSEVIAAFRAYVMGQGDKAQIIATFRQYVIDSRAR